ncbi:unnamed protein product [Leuciscus chuanchicus]
MRWPGIEPGSTAWKAAMLTTIPPTQAVGRRLDADLCGQQECPQHISSWQGAGEDVEGEDYLSLQLLVSIVDSISACHAEDRGSIPRRGDLVLYCCPKTHTKVLLQQRVTEGVGHTKGNALAGNRTRVNCLEGSYAHHYTTNAGSWT